MAAPPKIVCGFNRMKEDDLLAKTLVILTNMTDNPVYPSPQPTLGSIRDLLSNYQAECNEVNLGNMTRMPFRDQLKGKLAKSLTLLGSYVTLTAAQNIVDLESSGFTLAKIPTATPDIKKPKGLVVKDGVNKGSMIIKIGSQKYVKMNVFQYSIGLPKNETGWTSVINTKRSVAISGLTPNVEYAICVTSLGARQQAVTSDVIYWTVR